MSECSTLNCRLVQEDLLSAKVKSEKTLSANLNNTVLVHQTYTGIDTDDIDVTVDNENYTISAVKKTYIHEQAVASAVWEINHNLGRYPSITVVDSAGDVVQCDPKYIDENNVRLDFTAEFGGKAYLN